MHPVSAAGRSRVIVERPGKPGLYQLAALPGWEVVGTVSDADGIGALVRNKATGVYCRANGGALRSLPQHKVLAAIDAIA
jgi:hypothetical protein